MDKLNIMFYFTLHIHLLLTEGLLSEKTDDYCEPISYPLPKVSFRNINYLWRNKVLSLLKNFKKITHKEFLEYRKMYPKGDGHDVLISSSPHECALR